MVVSLNVIPQRDGLSVNDLEEMIRFSSLLIEIKAKIFLLIPYIDVNQSAPGSAGMTLALSLHRVLESPTVLRRERI